MDYDWKRVERNRQESLKRVAGLKRKEDLKRTGLPTAPRTGNEDDPNGRVIAAAQTTRAHAGTARRIAHGGGRTLSRKKAKAPD